MKKIYTKNFILFTLISLLSLSASFLAFTENAKAQYGYSVQCEFTHNLQLGSVGEDVRCLQRFLNSQGFVVSSYGSGALGNESTYFGQLTANAVSRWQATNGIFVNGIWGPSSISIYYRYIGQSTQNSQNNYSNNLYSNNSNYNYPYTPNTSSNQDSEIRNIIENLRDLFDEFFDELDNASQREIDDSRDSISDATNELLNSFVAFISRDSNGAVNRALEAESLLEDAVDEIGGSYNNDDDDDERDDARDAIEDAEDRIDYAEDEIRDADNDGQSVSRAERLLDDAKDYLEDAKDAFDDEDYDDAIDFAEEAEELADEAVDAL